jgi:hypothetical protein
MPKIGSGALVMVDYHLDEALRMIHMAAEEGSFHPLQTARSEIQKAKRGLHRNVKEE